MKKSMESSESQSLFLMKPEDIKNLFTSEIINDTSELDIKKINSIAREISKPTSLSVENEQKKMYFEAFCYELGLGGKKKDPLEAQKYFNNSGLDYDNIKTKELREILLYKNIIEKLERNLDKYIKIIDEKLRPLKEAETRLGVAETNLALLDLERSLAPFKKIKEVTEHLKDSLKLDLNEYKPYEECVRNFNKILKSEGDVIKNDANEGSAFMKAVNEIVGPVISKWIKKMFSSLRSEGEKLHDKSEELLNKSSPKPGPS